MSPLADLGDRVWLVLGGGGLKGLAHIGAWRAIEEAGAEVDGVVGTSIGALVGACVAGGMGWEEMTPPALALRRSDIVRIHRRAVWVNGIRQPSLFRGDVLSGYIREVLPVDRWEDLVRPLEVNAVDLSTGRTEWFGPGARTDLPLEEAVYASAALPVFFPPLPAGSSYLVDGSVGDQLPLHRPAELGATGILAVDVGSGAEEDASKVVQRGMLAVHQRVFSIMSGRRRRETAARWAGPPLLYVRPRLDGYSTFDFENVEYFLTEGYEAVREALFRHLGADVSPGEPRWELLEGAGASDGGVTGSG